MTTEEKLQQAEGDLERMLARANNVLPTLKRIADDPTTPHGRRDTIDELYINLANAISDARANQLRRLSRA